MLILRHRGHRITDKETGRGCKGVIAEIAKMDMRFLCHTRGHHHMGSVKKKNLLKFCSYHVVILGHRQRFVGYLVSCVISFFQKGKG